MFALNFQSQKHEKLLLDRQKNCTIRLGDVSSIYRENSIVWITTGVKYTTKRKLYSVFLDKVQVKTIAELTSKDLGNQNPDIKTVDQLIENFENIYNKKITREDTVTVIYFNEVIE